VSAYKLAGLMASYEGLAYMRTLRPAMPAVYKPGEVFHLVGQKVLAEGKGLTLVAWGYMVHEALAAARELGSEGIACGVVDAYSLPLADDFLDRIGAAEGATLLVVEDNYAGGIGSAVAEAAAARGGVRVVALTPGRMPKSGKTADDILKFVGLDAAAIAARARAVLGRA
jgi:transketolase